jgi:NADH:ubiquinone oxidoreductase subunit E
MPVAEKDKKQELREFIETVMKKEHGESYLVAVMHKAQELYGYLSREVMDDIAGQMQIPTAHIWGVATFYHYFNLNPPGKYVISVCLGTACYVKGASQVLDTIRKELKIDLGGITANGLFSLQPARCLGACGVAPVVMVGDKIHGEMTPQKVTDLINQYRKAAKKING